MAWAEAKERLLNCIEGLTPDANARIVYRRVAGSVTTATVPRTSGGWRRIDILPGTSRRGSTVNGFGPKQVINSAVLEVVYPKTGQTSQPDTLQDEKDLLRSVLEDPRNYASNVTGLQNVKVTSETSSEVNGAFVLLLALEVTYIGKH